MEFESEFQFDLLALTAGKVSSELLITFKNRPNHYRILGLSISGIERIFAVYRSLVLDF